MFVAESTVTEMTCMDLLSSVANEVALQPTHSLELSLATFDLALVSLFEGNCLHVELEVDVVPVVGDI